MREVAVWILITASVIAFTVALELKVEEAIGSSWYLPFTFLWLALVLYFVWVGCFIWERPRYWAVAMIAVGVVVGFQSIAIPVILDHTTCSTTDHEVCAERRTWISRVVFIPIVVIEVAVLLYIIRDYAWKVTAEKEKEDAYMRGLQSQDSNEWAEYDAAADLEEYMKEAKKDLEDDEPVTRSDDYIYDQ